MLVVLSNHIQRCAWIPDSCQALNKDKSVPLSWPAVCPFKPPDCNPFSVQLIHSRLFQLCITHRFVQRHSHKLLVSMLVQPLSCFFFWQPLHAPQKGRERERKREREKEETREGGRVGIACDECLSTERLYRMSLTLIKTICFLGAARLLSHAPMSTDSLTLMTP